MEEKPGSEKGLEEKISEDIEEGSKEEEEPEEKIQEDSEKEEGEDESDDEEFIGKIRLAVSNSSSISQTSQAPRGGGLEKEIFTGDDVWGGAEDSVDLIEEKYRTEDREKEEKEDSVKYNSNEDNFYDSSSNKHYDEKSLSGHKDDFEVEIGSRDLKDRKNEEFYSLRKDSDKENERGIFESDSKLYFESKEKEYLA